MTRDRTPPPSLHSGADGYGAVHGTESNSAADRLNRLDAYVKAVHAIIELWEHFSTAVFESHGPPLQFSFKCYDLIGKNKDISIWGPGWTGCHKCWPNMQDGQLDCQWGQNHSLIKICRPFQTVSLILNYERASVWNSCALWSAPISRQWWKVLTILTDVWETLLAYCWCCILSQNVS